MVCTVDCLSTYKCGSLNSPPEGAIYAPYVRISFGNKSITVGNKSAPPDNAASITSFQYGFQSGGHGWGADFEIIDMGGVMYERIIAAINKTVDNTGNEVFDTDFDFGWIIKDCDGNTTLQTTGTKLYGLVMNVESTHEAGFVKLKLRVESPTARVADVRHDNAIGDETNKVYFTDALTRLFKENDPKFPSVKFLDKDGKQLKFKNSDGDETKGPKGIWPMSQMNSLAIARNWWNPISTKNDLGVVVLYDPNSASLIFQEDKLVHKGNCCKDTMGTYIVNGGNCSPVLGFTPTIIWPKGLIPGSGATPGGAFSGNNNKDPNAANTVVVQPNKPIEKAGIQSSPTIQQHDLMWRNPDDLASKGNKAFAAQLETNAKHEMPLPGFEAELKLIGDPQYSDGPGLFGKHVSIVYINPFHVDNCKWITTTNCNSTLSNKNYIILGVSHQITGGSFITTLKLYLPTPNNDIPATDPLGECGTITFDESLGASRPADADASQG